MAFRKRMKKRVNRRRPAVRRRPRVMRPLRSAYTQQRVFKYVRNLDGSSVNGLGGSSVITQGAAAQNFALAFTLNDVPAVSEYTNLYDQYLLRCCVVRLVPMLQSNTIVSSSTIAAPLNPGFIMSVIDWDDANTISTIAAYQQYQNMKLQPVVSNKTHKRVVFPRSLGGAFNGTSVVASTNQRAQWTDCATPTISHFGYKLYVPPYASINSAQTWQVQLKYYIWFRNVR